MARPRVRYDFVERGIQRVTRTYEDGRTVVAHRIKYADANGRIMTRTIPGNVTKARASLAEARDEVNKGKHVVISKQDGRTTFKAAADHWIKHATHLKRSTRQSHSRIIDGSRLADLHDVRMRDLTHERMQVFQASLVHLAPATQRQLMWIVKAICEDAVNRGLLRANPCAKLKQPKARKRRVSMPSKEEVRSLLDRLSSPTPPVGSMGWGDPDPRWRLIVETAAFTGLRAGELVGLKVEDLDANARSLTVVRSIPTNGIDEDSPKTEAGQRTIGDLRPDLCRRLSGLVADKRPSDYLFGWTDSEGVSRPYRHMNFYRRVFKPACNELGIEGRFHDLRHFHASLLIEANLDPVRVAARLGHEKPSFTLDVYSHLFRTETTGLGAALDREWSARPMKKAKKPF
jgi:integrase